MVGAGDGAGVTRRLVVESPVAAPTFALRPDQAHYLLRVLRMTDGDEVDLVGPDGSTWRGTLDTTDPPHVCALTQVRAAAVDAPPAVLVAALLKQNRWETLVEKATELGATALLPVQAERSVVKVPAAKADAKRSRWQRIADGATRQSEQHRRIEVLAPTSLAGALRETAGHVQLWLDERAPNAKWPAVPASSGIALFVGPEGGWAPSERAVLEEGGAQPVGLGPGILRAETAAIAALTAVRLRRSGLL